MAARTINISKVIKSFEQIVKRKTVYNETNLHFEYFKLTGDTIPFKDYGYDSLKDFIQKNAGDSFYFEKVARDFEFIAPKRKNSPEKMEFDSTASSDESNELAVVKHVQPKEMETNSETTSSPSGTGSNQMKKLTIVKHVSKNLDEDEPSPPRKHVCISHKIHFSSPQSTGTKNPFQDIRNDIRISFDVSKKTRKVDCQSAELEKSGSTDIEMDQEHLNHQATDVSESGAYSVEFSSSQVDNLPWEAKYWHMKITNPVSTGEIWARFYDEFEVSYQKFLFAIEMQMQKLIFSVYFHFIRKKCAQ